MKARKPFVVPALAGILPFRLKAVQQTAKTPSCNFLGSPERLNPATLPAPEGPTTDTRAILDSLK